MNNQTDTLESASSSVEEITNYLFSARRMIIDEVEFADIKTSVKKAVALLEHTANHLRRDFKLNEGQHVN